MATRTVTPQPPELPSDSPADRIRARIAQRRALDGKLNCVGDVSLTDDGVATTTDITSPLITENTHVSLSPLGVFAAAEIGAGSVYITYPSPGVARVNHSPSVQARAFRYLLIGLLLLFADIAPAQVIQDDGTPLEVRPALNFDAGITCTNDADSTNCESSLVTSAEAVDSDSDGIPEIYCIDVTNTCIFDTDEDGASELSLTATDIEYDSQFRAADGLGVGNGSVASSAVSACIGRDTTATVDRLFEDKDCDFATTTTPEAGEGMLSDILARNTVTHTLASTTATEVTGLRIALNGLTAYMVEYAILSQSSSTSVGLAYGVDFTGTATLNCTRTYPGDGTAATTGVIDDVAATNTGQIVEHMTTNAASSTAPNLGPNAGVVTTNSTALESVECVVVVTALGNLRFWHASETATNTSVMANSVVKATRIN